LNTETDSKFRLCQQSDETIDHIISACPILANEQYIKRHDRVCAQLHFNICKETGVQLDKKTLIWTCAKISRNKSRRQGKHIVEPTNTNQHNYPKQQTRHYNPWYWTCMLIDVAISGDRNVIEKEADKILKYKELTTEI